MPYRNDQLVGCLPDDDLDLMNLPLTNTNQDQFNQLNRNQFIVDSNLQSNQLRANQTFEVDQTRVSNSQLNSQLPTYLDNNTSPTFNFQPTDQYDNQLHRFDQLTNQFDQLTNQSNLATNFDSNSNIFGDIDDEIELNHLKDLEIDLMDTSNSIENTNQLPSQCQIQTNQLNVNQLNTNQLTPNRLSPAQLSPNHSNVNQLTPNRLSPAQLSPNHLNVNQLNTNQLQTNQLNRNPQVILTNQQSPQSNQTSTNQQSANQFLNSNTNHPTFDNRFNSKSAQINTQIINTPINTIQRTPSNIQTNNSANDNSFLASVNSRSQLSQVNNPTTCNNFLLKSTSPNISFSRSPNQFPSQLTNNSSLINNSTELNAYCDPILNPNLNTGNLNQTNNANNLTSNLNLNITNTNLQSANQLNSHLDNQLEDSFYQEQQTFCQESDLQSTSSSTMCKSDLQTSNLLTSNMNYYQQNQLINSPNQLLNNQANQFKNSSNLSTMINISNSSRPIKQHLSTHFIPNASNDLPNNHLSSPSNNNLSKVKSPSNDWLDTIADQVAEDMRKCGICVIDNFLGKLFCNTILEEVIDMYSDGCFKDGLLVGNKQNGNKNIRGDKIHWVEGKEQNCQNIGYLMRTLDQILMRFSRKNIDGCTSIFNRTKAMVACYPGNGTKYVKHVDNPNKDGRYITCIYYLNKNWNSERDGGTLRIFPKNVPYVANIEPLFDRVIFFWSDRRNPHEVMPAFSIRFAITLWYFNSKEREQYIKKTLQNLQQTTQS